jgi:hypothetical protein
MTSRIATVVVAEMSTVFNMGRSPFSPASAVASAGTSIQNPSVVDGKADPPPGFQSWDTPHFQGGPNRDTRGMIAAAAAFRDEGGLPGAASLMLTQLLLNLAGHAGRVRAQDLIEAFFNAADVPEF